MGSATDEPSIRQLEKQARKRISQLTRQRTFNFIGQEEELSQVLELSEQIKGVQILGFELILGKIYREVGFDRIDSPIFRILVLTRVSYPGSKLKAIEYMRRNHGIDYDISTIYRYMDRLNASDTEHVQKISFEHTKALMGGVISLVFYDVTTLYFEAEQEDELRRIGFSKDGKLQRPQIVLGLLVSTGGYPLAFEMFEGNTFEGKTMLPVIERFESSFRLDSTIIIADAAMLSRQNIEELNQKQRAYIIGARIKSESKSIQQRILSMNLQNGQCRSITKPDGTRLIVSKSDKRAVKDAKNRLRGIQRLEKAIKTGKLTKQHINNRGYNKYLKMEGSVQVSIDRDKIKQDAQWDGLKGYITNSKLSNDQVIENYTELWQIEKAFRVSKTDLRIRPVYHRLRHRIKAHLVISFAAYKVYKELERQLKEKTTGISIHKAIRLMETTFGITIEHPQSNNTYTILYSNTDEHLKLWNAFDLKRVSH